MMQVSKHIVNRGWLFCYILVRLANRVQLSTLDLSWGWRKCHSFVQCGIVTSFLLRKMESEFLQM
ncbi:unnamed protein product [Dicrocoelium dendriticum]|nr:unnamed protein product [Dicrocoelium dendriticum]